MNEIIKTINEEIQKQTEYGTRNVIVPNNKFTFLNWSNNSESWYINKVLTNHYKIHSNNKICNLDANQIVVPYEESEVKEIIDELEELPLYQFSFEAKMRA